MDTTEKGDRLENQVYALFAELISENRFLAKKECCRIYKKKGYYSKDREKSIIFDVSVEITFPGQNTYSILMLIECKNYNYSVPVNDVEEFFSKTQQISGCNTKGVVVSTNSFQEGAFNFSKSKGIGLLRYYDKANLDWVLTRSPSGMVSTSHSMPEWSNVYHGLRSQTHVSKIFDCYGFIDDTYTNSIHQFTSSLIRFELDGKTAESLAEIERGFQSNSRLVPYKEHHEIELRCTNLLIEEHYEDGVVPLEIICASLSKKYDLEIQRNVRLGSGILGEISFDPPVIKIDDAQAETDQRNRFTLAHELGHLLLGHQKYMTSEACHYSDIDLENPISVGITDIVRMEWQANYFASCLLLPTDQFVKAFLIEAARNELVDKGYGLLYLDAQKCNQDTFYKVTSRLKNKFKVSRSAVKIRLGKLGFLNEASKMPNKSLQQMANHHFSQIFR